MQTPPQAVFDAIHGSSSLVVRRCSIFEEDGETLWRSRIPILDGAVSIDMNRSERRTLELTLANVDGSLDSSSSGLWYDKIIKVYRGIIYPEIPGAGFPIPRNQDDDPEAAFSTPISTDFLEIDGPGDLLEIDGADDLLLLSGSADPGGVRLKYWEAQLGEFMIDEIRSPHFPAITSIKGRDYTKKLIGDTFDESTTFLAGARLDEVVRAIAVNGHILKHSIPNDGIYLTSSITFEAGTTRWKAIVDLATAYGYEVFFDGLGYLIMRPFQDPALGGPSITFSTGAAGNLVSFDRVANDSLLYNAVRVTGQRSDRTPVVAVSENHDAGSPTSIERLNRRIVKEIKSSFIDNYDQALSLSRSLLKIYSLESYTVDLQSIVYPWLEGGDVIDFLDPDPNPGDPRRQLMTSLTIPLGLSAMSLVGKRVQIVNV